MSQVKGMQRRESNPLLSSRETSYNEMGASCGELNMVCLCQSGPSRAPVSNTRTLPLETLMCDQCGKSGVVISRYSDGYGTEEECVFSDPQGDSDADADTEDTDSRLQEPGSLQRISSRRRRRPRVSRQDTTESEDDGGRSHHSHRWNLRLSPHKAHSRTILEESVSQVRPLVICRPSAEGQKSPEECCGGGGGGGPWRVASLWSASPSLPVVVLVSLPLSLSLVMFLVSFLLPWASV